MADCTIEFFKNPLDKLQNYRIDNIYTYLEDECTLVLRVDDFQYQRILLNISFKLDLPQEQATNPKFNYFVITQDNRKYFYFIDSLEQVARKTVRVSGSLDTINSFWDDLKWSARTLITREHVDRFKKVGDKIIRVIDKWDEKLDPAKTRIQYQAEISQKFQPGNNWYLIWLSSSEVTPDKQSSLPIIPCFCSDQDFTYEAKKTYSVTEKTLENLSISQGYYYLSQSFTGETCSISLSAISDQIIRIIGQADAEGNVVRAFKIAVDVQKKAKIYKMWYKGDVYPYAFVKSEDATPLGSYDLNSIKIEGSCEVLKKSPNLSEYYRDLSSLDIIDQLDNYVDVHIGTIPEKVCKGINSLDRTSTKIIKINQLPYAPATYNDTLGTWNDCAFVPGMNLLRRTNLFRKLGSKINMDIKPVLEDIFELGTNTVDTSAKASIGTESKLFASEFYDLGFVYLDSKRPYALEFWEYNPAKTTDFITIDITYSQYFTNDIKFVFRTDNYPIRGWHENWLVSTPNNEVSQFNSSWIDYLRTGYNFDTYMTKRQNALSAINGALSLVGVGVAGADAVRSGISYYNAMQPEIAKNMATNSLIQGGYTAQDIYNRKMTNLPTPAGGWTKAMREDVMSGAVDTYNEYYKDRLARAQNPARWKAIKGAVLGTGASMGVGGLVALQGIQAINTAVSTFSTIESRNKQYQNDLAKRAYPSAVPEGGSSIDLMDNHMYLVAQVPEPEVIEKIANFFRFMGYAHPVQEVPDFTSRSRYNFVQCAPVFLEPVNVIHPEYEEDIKQRFNQGVTVFHWFQGAVDIEQEFENWEVSII